MSEPERASAASVAKRRLSALSEQLVSPIPDQGTFEGIPKLKKVAGPSTGPRATGKVVIITGMAAPFPHRSGAPPLARLACPVLSSGGSAPDLTLLMAPPLTHPNRYRQPARHWPRYRSPVRRERGPGHLPLRLR